MCRFHIKKSYLLSVLLKKDFSSFFSGMFGASLTIGEALTLLYTFLFPILDTYFFWVPIIYYIGLT